MDTSTVKGKITCSRGGDALIFQNGNVVEATWEKVSREARTRFFNEDGAEIDFVRGTTWLEILPKGNEVEY